MGRKLRGKFGRIAGRNRRTENEKEGSSDGEIEKEIGREFRISLLIFDALSEAGSGIIYKSQQDVAPKAAAELEIRYN